MAALTAKFRPDPQAAAKFKAMIEDLSTVLSPTDPDGVAKLLSESGARFVHNIADVTPPATGSADQAAKKLGEQAIVGDLLKLAVPLQGSNSRAVRSTLATAQDLIEAHARSLTRGRVNPRNRKDKLWMPLSAFNEVANKLMARVGWLAAGLNAAAESLGRPLPLWIRRHGDKFGKIEVTVSKTGIKLRIVQNVPFADDVDGYQRRWDFALARETNALHRQAQMVIRSRFEKKARHLKTF